ncbi:MAG: hypothetical protein DHS20C21_24200 [Gemmatimonadota bacterium]|nr:MAG: hypothetical protein DHS20C21_24200 [Gemmatimonadota bacterium]
MERKLLEDAFVMKMDQAGAWLKTKLPADAKIATTTIGAIAYSSNLHVIDMLGLTDREVARHPKMFDGLLDTWREVKYNAESVLEREPHAILFSTDVRPSSAAERALYLYESFHESYFPYYYRTRPWRRQSQTLHLRRSDAPSFRPDLVDVNGFDFIGEYIEGHIEKGRHRNNQAALEHFDRAIEIGPDHFLAAKEWRAVTLHDMGSPDALAALVDVVTEDPFATVAKGRLAVLYLQGGKLEAAESLLRSNARINPDDSLAWAGLAEVERQRGNLEVAYEDALRAVEIWTTNGAHLLLLARVSLERGDLAMARRAFSSALEVQPEGELATAARRGLEAVELVESGRATLEEVLGP